MRGVIAMNHMIVNVKEAVAIAIDHLKSIYGLNENEKPRLEETIIDDKGHWQITLSFKQDGIFNEREYKIFEIDANTKAVLAMRIREPNIIDGGDF
jgi:hypothetical protein